MKKTPRGQRPGNQKANVLRPAGPGVSGSGAVAGTGPTGAGRDEGPLVRVALRFTSWAERWFPDAFVFVAIAVVIVAAGALAIGAPLTAVTKAFGDGFWSLIPFTMQMVFVTIGGYVVATSPPAQRLIDRIALLPKTGRGAVGFIATVSMLASLLSWGLSLIFGGLLARAIARRADLRMDYRAAGAAAYLGLGATWALGLSSVRGAAPGQRREPAQDATADHRRDPVHRDDLPLAVHGHRPRADRGLGRDRDLVGAVRRRGRDCARPRRRPHPTPGGPGASPAAGRVARARAAADDPAGRAGARLAGAGVHPAERHRRDLEPEHLQLPVPHARPAAALAAQAISDRGCQVCAGDDRRADPVPVLRRHQLHPHHGGEPGRRHALSRDRRRLREPEHARQLPARHGRVLGGAGLLHPFRRRQVVARGALRHAGRQ